MKLEHVICCAHSQPNVFINQVDFSLSVIRETQPKEDALSTGADLEEFVDKIAAELLTKVT